MSGVYKMALFLVLPLFFLSASAQSSTNLVRESLSEYPLATCNDGSTAVYYRDEVE